MEFYCKKDGVWEKFEDVHLFKYADENNCSAIAVQNDKDYVIYRKKDGKMVVSETGSSEMSMENILKRYEDTNNNHLIAEALDRIFLKNTEKAFHESKKLTESAEVGLFWVDKLKNKVYGDGVPISQAEIFGRGTINQFAVHPSCHYDLWKEIKETNPRWKNREYEDLPRGRVVFKFEPNNNHFITFSSPGIKGKKYEEKIKDFFGLPSDTQFRYDDDHYTV